MIPALLEPYAGSPLIIIVNLLRAASTLSWACVVVRLAHAAARSLRGHPEPDDVYRMLFWCCSLLVMSFGVRWFLFPASMRSMVDPELIMWATTYAFSAVLGRAVFIAVRPHGR